MEIFAGIFGRRKAINTTTTTTTIIYPSVIPFLPLDPAAVSSPRELTPILSFLPVVYFVVLLSLSLNLYPFIPLCHRRQSRVSRPPRERRMCGEGLVYGSRELD